MKAARMYGVDDLRVEEIQRPKITEKEILVKVRAAAVCGTDIRMIKNGYAGISQSSPRILGHEIAGDVVEVGKEVTAYKIGDRVAIAPNMGCGLCANCIAGDSHLCPTYNALGINMDGGFAEYCVIPERAVNNGNVVTLEDGVSYEAAAINEPFSCVYNGFESCEVKPGDNVLIIGAGPIGILHAKLALMGGAGRVIMNDLSEDRLNSVKKMEPSVITIKDNLKEEICRLTGDGVDVCITACPSPAAQTIAPSLCTYHARVLFFGGVSAAKQPVPLDTNIIHYKELKILGTTRSSLTQYRRTLSFISRKIIDVEPLITNRFSIDRIHEAFEKTEKAEGLKNVIVFD